jgi:outer membrane protein TolC
MAALELAAAESAVTVAVQALAIASRGAVQATEAHRIVERKYEGGLATVAELLEAQATEMGAHLAEAKARYDVIVARGTLARVRAEDLAMLASALDAAAATRE